MFGFEKKYVVLKPELIFNFDFIRFFFGFRLPLRTFWSSYRDIFSIFCLKWQEIAFFSVKYSQILLKLRNSLLKGAKIPDVLPKFLRFPDELERILSIKFKIKSCSELDSLQNHIITFLKKHFREHTTLYRIPSELVKNRKLHNEKVFF